MVFSNQILIVIKIYKQFDAEKRQKLLDNSFWPDSIVNRHEYEKCDVQQIDEA